MVDEEQHLLDAFYVAFEDQFRGTREDIKNRVRVYLPVLHDAQIGSADTPVLDIGCGRGEWLELLHDEGLVGRGLDLNRVMIAQCREAALSAVRPVSTSRKGTPLITCGRFRVIHWGLSQVFISLSIYRSAVS